MYETILKKREFYNEFMNNLSEMIIYMDENFDIQWANQSALEYFEINLDKISGKKCFQKWGLDSKCEGCPVIKSRKTKQTEEMMMKKNDDKIWKMKAIPNLSETGEVEGFLELASNITEKRKIEEIRNLLENLVNQAPGMVYQYQLFPDGSSSFPFSSEGIKEIYEVSPEEAKKDASKIFQRLHPDDYDRVVNSIQKSAENLTVWQEEYRVILPKKGLRWVETKAIPEKKSDGSVLWYGNIYDITDRKNKEKELEEIFLFDPNSGLPNSSNLIKKVDELKKEKEIENLYLIMMEIENYEDIMNTIGHTKWGKFIKEIATQLKERQEINFIYKNRKDFYEEMEISVYNIYHNRVGFLLQNISKNKLAEFIKELKIHTDSPFYYNRIPIFLNTHLGLASYKQGDAGADLLQHAYQAMKNAVKDKKRVRTYEKNLETKTKEKFFLLGEVRNALDNNHFKIYYMPKIKLSTGEIEGIEALIRWDHPKQGNISPGRFIPPVEKTGLINELSRWVINKATEEKIFLKARGIDVNMAINISPRNLKNEDFIVDTKDILVKNNLSPTQFELELTETEIMEELIGGNNSLNLLSKEGFKISMDDFGTGYSSLAYLKNLDIDSIKIDRSFVQAMEEDTKNYEIVKTAVRLGKVLDKKVVAEGIENQEVMEELNKLGCDYGQGFYICKPIPKDEFVDFYNRWQEED